MGYPTRERNATLNALQCVAEIQRNQNLSIQEGKNIRKSWGYK